jgi:hypothetical protein
LYGSVKVSILAGYHPSVKDDRENTEVRNPVTTSEMTELQNIVPRDVVCYLPRCISCGTVPPSIIIVRFKKAGKSW